MNFCFFFKKYIITNILKKKQLYIKIFLILLKKKIIFKQIINWILIINFLKN